KKISGYYASLNNRLREVAHQLTRGDTSGDLFELTDVSAPELSREQIAESVRQKLGTWSPPATLIRLMQDSRPDHFYASLVARSRALHTRSYTSLGADMTPRPNRDSIETEEFKYDLEARDAQSDLRGGRQVGIFLHEVIEKLDLSSLEGARSVEAWRERVEIKRLITDLMRRHQVADPLWFERGAEIIFNALTSRLTIAGELELGPLYKCRTIREMEFIYPIPERSHPLLHTARDSQWTVERGYLKGFVDFVFEQNRAYYFADWKSDYLPSYDNASIAAHVAEHYDLQARIYSVGIVRLLGIRNKIDYDRRFGGLLYIFLRGVKQTSSDGIYFRRPDWHEICSYEQALIGAIPEGRPR
ncbi:MAG TPA: PD-(D/E)XK nuclease family protein, partial [Candidatus Binataceae bacterium]|nr:PD-(D/E)XK nuclease family protein [Candidatus Binataceae bacterium]